MKQSDLGVRVKELLLQYPGHGFSYQDLADRLGETVPKVQSVIPNLKSRYGPVERTGKAGNARVWWSTTVDPDVCPLGKIEEPRWRIARALAAAGGEVTDDDGKATGVLAEAANVLWPSAGLSALLRAMELDAFVDRDISGRRCYAIRLTEKGFDHFMVRVPEVERAEEPVAEETPIEPVPDEPDDEPWAPEPAPQPSAEPSVADPETPIRVLFYEGPASAMPALPGADTSTDGVPGIDYRELAHALARENARVGAPIIDTTRIRELEGQIEDLKIRLGSETEAAQRWRGEAQTYKRQLEEAQKKTTTARRAAAPNGTSRPVVTEMQQIVDVIDRTDGWSYERTGGASGTHIKILRDGKYVTTGSFGGSDHRSVKNCRAKLRREGLPV